MRFSRGLVRLRDKHAWGRALAQCLGVQCRSSGHSSGDGLSEGFRVPTQNGTLKVDDNFMFDRLENQRIRTVFSGSKSTGNPQS
jgi:hypothetical protein